MSALEAQIMEIVARMDENGKRRILELAQQLEPKTETPQISSWLDEAAAFRSQLRAKYGEDHTFDTQQTLDEIREERLNDIMGSD